MLEAKTPPEIHPSVERYLRTATNSGTALPEDVEGHIVHGDALDLLTSFPEGSVDLIHTSPPYNIDRPYRSDTPDRGSTDDYRAFLTSAITEMKRVLRPGGSIFWQTGYTQDEDSPLGIIPIDYLSYDIFRGGAEPLALWDRIIWRYWGGHAFTKKFTNKHETILWFVKPGSEPTFCVDDVRERSKEYDKRNNFWGRNPGNVWEVDRVAFGATEQTSHIAVFPEEISERIIRACSQPDDLVLDPFSGSGTVAKVGRGLGRRWVGIEISPVYAAESAVRVGFQQPCERDALASELLKHVVFGRDPGRQTLDEAVRRLRTWLAGANLEDRRRDYEADVATVFHDGNGRNSRKRAIWGKYDNLLEDGTRSTRDLITVADSLLLPCYKLRRRLSGVSRYKAGLDALEGVASRVTSPWAEGYVRDVANQEPSSYLAGEATIELVTPDRRILPSETEDSEIPTVSLSAGNDESEETFQSRLL